MKGLTLASFILVYWTLTVSCAAQQTQVSTPNDTARTAMEHHGMAMDHEQHGASVPVTYAELTTTASLLQRAHRATEKYRDVRIAEADGYRPTGPDVPGMGVHFVSRKDQGFNIEHPSILLYEKTSDAPGGYALVGVSYLLTAARGVDGQPANSPFPKSLVKWHRHENLCLFPDQSTKVDLNEDQCTAQGGQFTAETPWMIHAWIWKESPDGVFSPINSAVQ